MTQYLCCEPARRDEIHGRGDINGIDFLEVLDGPGVPDADRQRFLFVHFINDPTGLALTGANITITGGSRIPSPLVVNAVLGVDPRSGPNDVVLTVEVAAPGDFSIYTLSLVETPTTLGALAAIDVRLRSVGFSFKVACESDFDNALAAPCPPPTTTAPPIDYTARDFRPLLQVLLDRYTALTGDANTGHPADMATTLVELLAHVGDVLAYRQDAVATEATLDTARRRISARRHARLVDYRMHDGCNARVFAQLQVTGTPLSVPAGTRLLTTVAGLPRVFPPDSDAYSSAVNAGAVVFETLEAVTLHQELNRISFYTWGDGTCQLPAGSTSATLKGDLTPFLSRNMVLVLGQVASPITGAAADADLRQRQAVRLTSVSGAVDRIGGRFELIPFDGPINVTEVTWHPDDALAFPLVVSAETPPEEGSVAVPEVSVAWGNIVLADHGRTLDAEEDLGTVPEATLSRISLAPPESDVVDPTVQAGCQTCTPILLPPRYGPTLAEAPMTQSVLYNPAAPPASARATLAVDPATAQPAITSLISRRANGLDEPWTAVGDVLRSADRREFVAEVETGGTATLRFGTGDNGQRPAPGTQFRALYRVGNGAAGNIGAETLAHLVTSDALVLARPAGGLALRNPLPAVGGTEPETIEQVRRRAPFAFRSVQERAVTAADYADRALQLGGIQKAAATLRWTGSWHTFSIAADRLGGAAVDEDFEDTLAASLEKYRLMGHDLAIDRPVEVALDVAMTVFVAPEHFRADVRRALLLSLGSGSGGLFYPDAFSFGDTVYLSPIYAAVQSVEGVARAVVTQFERRDAPGPQGITDGALRFGRLEVPRLANDPNQPERGSLKLDLQGGK